MNISSDVRSGQIDIRIPYADTDQMGTVYYANYLIYFERGRTEFLRNHSLPYSDLESKGFYLPVMECTCKYISPARYDDLIVISTELVEIGFASLEFRYTITCDKRRIVTGMSKHPVVNRQFRPVRMPQELKQALENIKCLKNC